MISINADVILLTALADGVREALAYLGLSSEDIERRFLITLPVAETEQLKIKEGLFEEASEIHKLLALARTIALGAPCRKADSNQPLLSV